MYVDGCLPSDSNMHSLLENPSLKMLKNHGEEEIAMKMRQISRSKITHHFLIFRGHLISVKYAEINKT